MATFIGFILAIIVLFFPLVFLVGIPYITVNICENLAVGIVSCVIALVLTVGYYAGLDNLVSRINWNDGYCKTCGEQLHLVGGSNYGYVYSCENEHPIKIGVNPNNF